MMLEYLSNKVEFSPDTGLWRLQGAAEIKYRDSFASEIYFRKILSKAKDLSSESDELQSGIADIITEYHLSHKRGLLIKGFEMDENASVLEVGCGCGAITRVLGERFRSVLSVEGSPSRASIARQRTRDLPGVSILVAPFHELDFTKKFDLIFCIGVLEYSPMFIKGQDPYVAALGFFKNLLTEDGVLVVALENQMGLKYFAGHPEDHTAIPYDGIEGYPVHGARMPLTYGKKVLTEKFAASGFERLEYYYPFPDYKLPVCIVSQRVFERGAGINPGELIGQFRNIDYVGASSAVMNQKFAWREVGENGLIPDMANSFLILARNSSNPRHIRAGWDIKLYNMKRDRPFRSETTFVWNEERKKLTASKIFPYKKEPSGRLTLFGGESQWKDGSSLGFVFEKRLKDKGLDYDAFAAMLAPWVEFLCKGNKPEPNLRIPGAYFDAMPWNLFPENGGYEMIDREFNFREDLGLKFCVTRGVYYMVSENMKNANALVNFRGSTVCRVVTGVCRRIFGDFGPGDISDFVNKEAELGSIISGDSEFSIKIHMNRVLLSRICPKGYLRVKYGNRLRWAAGHIKSALNMLALRRLANLVTGRKKQKPSA